MAKTRRLSAMNKLKQKGLVEPQKEPPLEEILAPSLNKTNHKLFTHKGFKFIRPQWCTVPRSWTVVYLTEDRREYIINRPNGTEFVHVWTFDRFGGKRGFYRFNNN
mmetsp:Transcript_549/g.658  ORF Transcript_549/g.658 Transcript_549/m.658 type:complete len:106 (-) Transcript_549:337-654(-)